jgi:predicted O-methyltransferase YrrM
MEIPLSVEKLNSFKLKNHEYLVHLDYYDNLAGDQEYRLYSYLSEFFNDSFILDIGTLNGRSAVALSHNESNTVLSFDINDHIKDDNHVIYSKSNIKFNKNFTLDCLTPEIIKKTKIVMIDIDHHGGTELKIMEKLKILNFKGLIILDDIMNHPDPNINMEMKELWDKIPYNKYDVTEYAHWSGTGIVVMNDNITFNLL